MKRILVLVLSLMLMLSLAACGQDGAPAPADNADPAVSQQQPSNTTPSNTEPGTPDTTTPDTTTPDEAASESAPGEVMDFDTGISVIPAEWQKAIGNSMFGMNTDTDGEYSESYLNKFSGVPAVNYAKLIAYFDPLSYTEKLDGVYNCDCGQLQTGHNADASEMTITWLVN